MNVLYYIPEPIIQRVSQDNSSYNWFIRWWRYFTIPNKFRLAEDWMIILPNGQKIAIFVNFIFDGASIPFFLRPFITSFGPLLRSALLHDYGYKYNYLSDWDGMMIYCGAGRKFFDDMFREVSIITSNLKELAWVAWAAVRSLGFIPWNKHRQKD